MFLEYLACVILALIVLFGSIYLSLLYHTNEKAENILRNIQLIVIILLVVFVLSFGFYKILF